MEKCPKVSKKVEEYFFPKNQEPFQNLRNTKPRPSQGHQEHSNGSNCVFYSPRMPQSGESNLQKPHPTRPYNLKNCLRNHNFIQKRRRVLRTNPPHDVCGAEPQVKNFDFLKTAHNIVIIIRNIIF